METESGSNGKYKLVYLGLAMRASNQRASSAGWIMRSRAEAGPMDNGAVWAWSRNE
jgi:hypothetical protein